jgi:hypothetical protein
MPGSAYQEPADELSVEARDMHRALLSLQEELEAIDFYHQRVELCGDAALRAILVHNRDDEKEHASMLIEWIRSRDPAFSTELKDHLFP